MIYNIEFITDFIFVENKITPCDVILVPGGSRPQLAEKAVELYNNGMAKYILFSGHANPKIPEYISEAEYLKTEAVEAAKKAGAHEFIMEFPKDYETDIGQRGVKLSGGQRQRISVARVFLKDPVILIFDEATSTLDYESERVVMENLKMLSRGRTTFIIAHRLSTVKNADRIIVPTDDGIYEQGTHEQLYAMDGIYANLYNS